MAVKHYFARSRGWTPREVDELTVDEVFWLPVMEEAGQAAAEQVQAAEQRQ